MVKKLGDGIDGWFMKHLRIAVSRRKPGMVVLKILPGMKRAIVKEKGQEKEVNIIDIL